MIDGPQADQAVIPPDENPQNLLKRRARAVAKKENWRELLDSVYKYALPNRNPWELTSPGDNLNWDVYDSTLVLGLRKFVNRMINALVPPDSNWVNLVAGTVVPDEEQEQVNADLQEITELFFFYLRQSNFDLVIHEAFTDMGISTGVLQINEGDDNNPLMFSAIPSNSVAFESGPLGDLSAFFRDWHNIPEDHAKFLWGDDFVVPDHIRRSNETVAMNLYEISYFDFKEKNYKTFIIEESTSEIVFKKVEESWEWIGFRWSKLAGEDGGRGPAIDAFPTAATINKAMEDELKSAALTANPPMMAYTDNVINPYTLNVAPNEIIPVKAMGTETWPLAPLPIGGNISFTSVIVNDLRAQVNEIMMAQPLQPLQDGPVRTATEVAVVQNELRENAGAQFSRVQKELFDPLVRRVLWILQKKGLIPNLTIDGKEIALSYKTPLSASKDQTDVQTFLQHFEIMSGIFTPGVAVNLYDAPKLPRWTGEKLGAKLDLIKDEKELLKLINDAQEIAKDAIQDQQPGAGEVDPAAVAAGAI